MWSPDSLRDGLLEQVADVCLELSTNPARRQVAVRALAQTAVTEEQIAALRRLAGDDVDLRWRTLTRLAEIDSVDPAEVDQLVHDDPDPDSWVRALAVDSARPDPAKKEATWKAIVEDHRVPRGALATHRSRVLAPVTGRDSGPVRRPLPSGPADLAPRRHDPRARPVELRCIPRQVSVRRSPRRRSRPPRARGSARP